MGENGAFFFFFVLHSALTGRSGLTLILNRPLQTFAKTDLPKQHRMVKEGDMMTMDHNPERYVFHSFGRGLDASRRFPRCYATLPPDSVSCLLFGFVWGLKGKSVIARGNG